MRSRDRLPTRVLQSLSSFTDAFLLRYLRLLIVRTSSVEVPLPGDYSQKNKERRYLAGPSQRPDFSNRGGNWVDYFADETVQNLWAQMKVSVLFEAGILKES